MYEQATHKPRPSLRKERARVIPLCPAPSGSGHLTPMRFPFPLASDNIIVDTSLHALLNCLQTIGLGVELLHLTQPFDVQDHDRIQHSIEQAGRFALELREYCFPPTVTLWTKNLATSLEEALQESVREWERPGRTARIICYAPLSEFTLDWQHVTKAVQRTVFCAYAMLPLEGGELIVESGVRTIGAQQFIDIRVQSRSETPLVIEEKALFCPFACISGQQLGLSLVLVQQTMARLQGQFSFHKTNARHGCFTLLFRT
jgi:hypothetical protein